MIHNKLIRIVFCTAIGSILLLGCTKESEEGKAIALDKTLSTKVVKLTDNYSSGSVLLKFTSKPDAATIEKVLSAGAESVEPLFTSTPGREELEAQFGLPLWYEAKLPEGTNLDKVVANCAEISQVSLVEYNHKATKTSNGFDSAPLYAASSTDAASFNDPYLSYQWHYHNTGSAQFGAGATSGADVGVKEVWDELGIGGDPSIIVAVIDEGVKYSHPDLAANMWVNTAEIAGNGIDDDGNGYVDDVYGYNFCDDGPITWALDGDSGHATHCAGTIAAVNNNGIGVSGVAGGTGNNDGCRIMSCQIFSGNGGGAASMTARAIKYAADMGASVISCSFGYDVAFASDNAYIRSQGSAEIDVIHYFEACKNNSVIDGGIAVFSSGNDGRNFASYPGAFVDVISVSAFGPDFLPTYYTNYGPGCNISAPGGELGLASTFASEVLSTVPSELSANTFEGKRGAGNDYGYMQGTSMACPHVSGVVALGLAYAKKQGKTFTRDEFKNMVLSSTSDIDQKISKTTSKSYRNVSISGTNNYYSAHADLQMSPFYHQMGVGAIDAWQLMMKIDGIPSLQVSVGDTQWVSLESAFGTSSVSLTYLSVDVPESTVNSLGLQMIEAPSQSNYPAVPTSGYAYVQFGRLYVHPTKVGAGTITISAIGGGDHVGGGDNAPGGMEMHSTVSLVSRPFKSSNQAWL